MNQCVFFDSLPDRTGDGIPEKAGNCVAPIKMGGVLPDKSGDFIAPREDGGLRFTLR